MAEITYLIGAGASYNALPIVSQMSKRIVIASAWLERQYQVHHIPNRGNTADSQKFTKVIEDLNWLKEICDTSKNFSVDTYARKLNLAGKDEEYQKLKNILSFYFTLEQKINSPDIRYDNFWASILKHKSVFPSNIKIISWNYDFQFELTYQDFLGANSLSDARDALRVVSLETPRLDIKFDYPHLFGIFKLNGSATFNSNRENGTNYLIDNFNELKNDDFIIELVNKYELLCKNVFYKNHLSFAWDNKINIPFYNLLKESVKNTEILVVIGYSFPFFNREIDKLILNDFMGDNLKKVYFQAPASDIEDIRERFLAINNKIDPSNLLLRTDIKQFTLPNEL